MLAPNTPASSVLVHAADFLDLAALERQRAEGLISVREHPETPLRIYNYTARAQYQTAWTPETLACRGLILDPDGFVVARPFQKFFNLSQHLPESSPFPRLPLGSPFLAFEKLDGSLGISYRNPARDRIEIATRGSFTSEQAYWATEWWEKSHGYLEIPEGQTWLFEIIYPGNRIVVDYRDRAELVLLAVVDNATGFDLPLPASWSGAVAGRFDVAEIDHLTALVQDPANFEGFVILFPSTGQRVKVKLDEYVRLHRVLSTCNTRTVWELLSAGQTLDEVLDRVPDDFGGWIRRQEAALLAAYRQIEAECLTLSRDPRVDPADRKAAAQFLTQQKHPPVLFKMLDGKDYAPLIWKAIRPEHALPFVKEEE
jgi:RNA ligase